MIPWCRRRAGAAARARVLACLRCRTSCRTSTPLPRRRLRYLPVGAATAQTGYSATTGAAEAPSAAPPVRTPRARPEPRSPRWIALHLPFSEPGQPRAHPGALVAMPCLLAFSRCLEGVQLLGHARIFGIEGAANFPIDSVPAPLAEWGDFVVSREGAREPTLEFRFGRILQKTVNPDVCASMGGYDGRRQGVEGP